MGIRGKLLFPLFSTGVSFALLLHLYWLPQFRASETVDIKNQERANLQVLAAGLISPLLTEDLAQIHATLDLLLEKKPGWTHLYLRSPNDLILYPVLTELDFKPKVTEQWIRYPVQFEGDVIATLELEIDIESLLAKSLEHILNLERLLVIVLLIIITGAALLQDRWIRKPLKSLVDATSRVADGDFRLALSDKVAADEVGRLVNAFGLMGKNLLQREEILNRQHTLLRAISSAQSRFIRDSNITDVFHKLLQDILSLTGSEFGIIGEVLYRDDERYLNLLSVSNTIPPGSAPDIQSNCAFPEHELWDLTSLIGAPVTRSETIIVNDPVNTAGHGALPRGFPPLHTFLGIPLHRDKKVVGIFAIANRTCGYDSQLVEFLTPITTTCTHIVEAVKADRQRQKAETQVRERETRFHTIFENVVDGIITTNENGVVETINRAAAQMFGYNSDEIIGTNVSKLTPNPYQQRHDEFITLYLKGRESKIIGSGREVEGLRKDGTLFPIDIVVNEMWIGKQRLFCSVMRDITERKKIDKMKNEFISTVSHELRTPLTSIRGSLGLLLGNAVGELPQQIKYLLDIASKNTERLLLLINDILDIEKIESGQLQFKFKHVWVKELLEHAIEVNHTYAGQQDIRIELREVGPNDIICGDFDRLVQVMNNLLSNAIKFSPPGTSVGVSAHPYEDKVRVSVIDQGPGIPEDFHDKIFDKFTQSDSSDTRKIGGTGLGFSITKAIVEKHGGNIGFSTQQNKGTTFYFDIPIPGQNKSKEHVPNYHYPSSDSNRILIIEDDHDVAALLRMMLLKAGFNADIAYNALQAKQLINTAIYAAITLDIVLPDQDGISLLRELRAAEATKNIPVIIVSAKANTARSELNGGALNVVDWLSKPVDPTKLLWLIESITVSRPTPAVLYISEASNTDSVVSELQHRGIKVIAARTVQEALTQSQDNFIDMVVMDFHDADSGAVSFLEHIKHRIPPIPVVLVSDKDVDSSVAKLVNTVLIGTQVNDNSLRDTISSIFLRAPPLDNDANLPTANHGN